MDYATREEEILRHPERHRHTFEELVACCTEDGVLNIALMQAHEKYVQLGTNGGVRCDVVAGPCSCGGWH